MYNRDEEYILFGVRTWTAADETGRLEGNALGSVCDGVVCEGDKEGGLEMLEHSIDDSGSGDGFVIRREELVKVLIQRNNSHEI